ncbi:hypothetical protein ACQ86K_08130 [Mucilaginibacter sp. P19]|uniref:hypothetical protein n=1 Tax=Mucilaginibacter sp. P19 TaxID=3423947 RepID=UPI003D67004C
MKFIKYASLLVVFFFTHILISSATQFSSGDTLKSPAKNWKEHWFEHDLIVSRTYADANVVFYYDDNMYPSVTWPYKTMSAVWAYVKKHTEHSVLIPACTWCCTVWLTISWAAGTLHRTLMPVMIITIPLIAGLMTGQALKGSKLGCLFMR